MDTVILGAAALFFLGMGVLALARPAQLVTPFGISLSGPDARLEVCAVYGGFGIAMPLMMVTARSQTANQADRPRLSVKPTDDFEVTGTGEQPAWRQTEWTPLRRRLQSRPRN